MTEEVSTRPRALKKPPKRTIVLLVILLIALFALGSVLFVLHSRSSGDGEPITPEGEYPAFVYNSAQVLQAYETAISIPEVLAVMPCYCNCSPLGHKNLKDCFLREDGSLEDHGAYCGACILEALDVAKWQEEGYSLKQIREKIDDKYHRYGEPTDTPPLD